MADLTKNKGLIQLDSDALIEMALTNLLAWSSIWRQVRKTDCDSNGMIDEEEFRGMFKDHFPEFFEGKSISAYLKKF